MACHGTLDVVVHFHRFRNVDLFSRGIYMVRVSVEKGLPYAFYSKPSTLSTFVRSQEIPCPHASSLPAAQIVDETSEFSTRAFVIKYRDERLDLSEGCQFQLLLESSVEEDVVEEQDDEEDESSQKKKIPRRRRKRLVFERGEPIVIKLELLMAELEKPKQEPKKQSTSVAAEKPSSSPLFTRIASQSLSVVCDEASQQLHAYYPVTFSAMHFCQLDATVHVALINLKFRKRGRYTRGGGDERAHPKDDGDVPHCDHFHELLFPCSKKKKEGGQEPVDRDEARDVHHAFLQPMLQSLGATAAALRNMKPDDDADSSSEGAAPSSRAVAGVMALIKQPYAEGSPFGLSPSQANASGVSLSSSSGSSSLSKKTTKKSPSFSASSSSASSSNKGAVSSEARSSRGTNNVRDASSFDDDDDVEQEQDQDPESSSQGGAQSSTLTPVRVANCVEADVKLVARRLFLLWGRFVAHLPQGNQNNTTLTPTGVVARLQRTWLGSQRRFWASRLKNHYVKVQKILQPREPSELDGIFTQLRASPVNRADGPKRALSVFDNTLLKDPALLPVASSHVYVRREQAVPPADNNVDLAPGLPSSEMIPTIIPEPPAAWSLSALAGALPTSSTLSSSTADAAPAKNDGSSSRRRSPNHHHLSREEEEEEEEDDEAKKRSNSNGTATNVPRPPSERESSDGGTSSSSAKKPPPTPVLNPGLPALNEDDGEYRGPHLIVMQHGWYASSFDMRLLRAFALLLFPRAVVLSPQSNEDNTGGSIGPMGQRLAHEVHNFIKHRCHELGDPDPSVGRISFVGHSAGSMIVRTALTAPVFAPYLPKLHAFISLSSSHCGNLFVPSTIVSGGMWALQRLHHSTFMNELQLLDDKNMEKTFMYTLSQAKGFELFRYVVLVGSVQDSYVPMHTAQATIPRPAEHAAGARASTASQGNVYVQMAANLMKPITAKTPDDPKQTTVVRLTLDHKFTQTNLDTMIGRAAHLAYIDSSPAVLLLLFSLYNILK